MMDRSVRANALQNDVVAEGSPDSIAREKQLRTLQRRTRKDETWFKRAMEVPIGRLIGLSIQTKVTLISDRFEPRRSLIPVRSRTISMQPGTKRNKRCNWRLPGAISTRELRLKASTFNVVTIFTLKTYPL